MRNLEIEVINPNNHNGEPQAAIKGMGNTTIICGATAALRDSRSVRTTMHTIYALISTNMTFVKDGKRHPYYVRCYRHTDKDVRIYLERMFCAAKQYKTYNAAVRAAEKLGKDYKVIAIK